MTKNTSVTCDFYRLLKTTPIYSPMQYEAAARHIRGMVDTTNWLSLSAFPSQVMGYWASQAIWPIS